MHGISAVRDRRDLAFGGLLLGMLMAQLDGTVVIAALPQIGRDLGVDGAFAGVTAAYLLTVTIGTPLLGRLGDALGRRPVFVASVLLFGLGSLACGAAPTMEALVVARALQGFGGGGLVVTAISTLAELFSSHELRQRQGWLTALFAISSVAGPPLGGLLAGGPGWRWIFLCNLPLCVPALAAGMAAVPRVPGRALARLGFDVWGAVWVAITGASVVLVGSVPALAGSPVWGPALVAVAVAGAAAFWRSEHRARAPLIPPRLFADRVLLRTVAVTFLTGVALFGTFTYMPLAIGGGPTTTGFLLLPMTVGQVAMSTCFAVLARRRPRESEWGRLAVGLGAAGLLGLAAVPLLSPGPVRPAVLIGGLALAGAGLGLSLQAYTLLGQARAPRGAVGATMATLTFTRQLGGSLGIALFGWLALAVAPLAGSWAVTAVFGVAGAALLSGLVVAPGRTPAAPP